MKSLLVALAHPDDEVGCAGTIATHTARGDRVVLLWLTRGTMTEAFAGTEPEEAGRIRTAHGEEVARMLGAEARFMDFRDTRLEAGPEAAARVARVVADVKPDAVVTWGEAWTRGMRHPDHQAAGAIVRAAVTLARIGRVVAPLAPHRAPAPVFTLRDTHSALPCAAVDVSAQLELAYEVGRFYFERVGWPEPDWHRRRLESAGVRWGVPAAELFDAWDTRPGLFPTLV